jgi:tyrosine-protein phosphatase YwqE
MFKLFSRSKSAAGKTTLQGLKTDIHSHLLPGIDDGAKDVETSLQLIKGMLDLGYTKLVTTPHVMGDMYPNTREIILEKLDIVRAAAKTAGIDAEIHAAAEYFLDDHMEKLLKTKAPLLTISGNMVLTEFSLAYPSHGLKDILFEMQMQNYQPVIAHPERYVYLEKNKEFYEELKDIGCLFQLNLLSLTGYYGKAAQELAHYLVKKGYYDLAGTDLHNFRHLDALHNPSLGAQLGKLMDSGKIRNPDI